MVQAAQIPITATSANLSGESECTTALAVRDQLQDRIAIIVDGGTSPREVASTIIDLTDEEARWRIMREGAIPVPGDLRVFRARMNEAAEPASARPLAFVGGGADCSGVAVFLGITSIQIVRQAGLQEVHPSDAIVVFGAAQYAGRPSPVFRARLDHAYDLFQRGVAPVVITTGGSAR